MTREASGNIKQKSVPENMSAAKKTAEIIFSFLNFISNSYKKVTYIEE